MKEKRNEVIKMMSVDYYLWLLSSFYEWLVNGYIILQDKKDMDYGVTTIEIYAM